MVNQQNIVPLGRLLGITVDIEGVRTTTDFEVIKIVDDSNYYPTFLRLDLAFDNMAIINLKKRQMIFESKNMRVIIPLDPSEGVTYTEPVKEEYITADIDNIYQMTAKEQDCVNPTRVKLSWEHDSSCASDSKEELENWQKQVT